MYIYRTWVNFKVIYKITLNNYDGDLNPKFINYDFEIFILY